MSKKPMEIKQKVLGMVATNFYLLINPDTKEAILVDPADETAVIKNMVADEGVRPVAILLTHGHFDHILAVDEVRSAYDIKVYAGEEEKAVLEDPRLNMSGNHGMTMRTTADVWLKDNEKFTLAGYEITAMHTPGHTPGGMCYYIESEGILLSGDTLFAESVGRTDFPGSSPSQMNASIKRLLSELPDEVKVYPGHQWMTTIEHEKRYNPFA